MTAIKEIERTFLAKELPPNLAQCPNEEISDIYIPKEGHAVLRIRRHGNRREITKKQPLGADRSTQDELTIPLSAQEWEPLAAVDGKKVRKTRYYYPWKGQQLEIDVFHDDLEGLVMIDAEFQGSEEKDAFIPPSFCLADVTQEEFLAGGALSGKSYKDIAVQLEQFGYKKITH